MQRESRWVGVLILAAAAALASLAGCDRREGAPAGAGGSSGKVTIAVSLPPLADLVKRMTSPWAKVVTLLPPGSSPHGFDASSTQLAALTHADLLVTVGQNMDLWAERMGQNVSAKHKLQIVRFADLVGVARPASDASEPAGTEPEQQEELDLKFDQHLWLDPALVKQFVAGLTPVLLTLAPDDVAKRQVELASADLQKQLDALDADYRQQLAPVPVKDLITFHNAFDLIAKRYGLKVVMHLVDIDAAPGGEVAASQLVEAITAVKAHHLKVLYSEPQFPDRAMQTIRGETGAMVLQLDPMEDPRPGFDYFDIMRSNLHVLVEGQSLTTQP